MPSLKGSDLSLEDSHLCFEELPEGGLSYWRDSWSRLCRNRPAIFGLIVLGVFVLAAGIVPIISPYTYYDTHLYLKNIPPCKNFWFGTDELGRDLFTRIWWGARISLFVGVAAAVIDMAVGVIYGATAGMIGGRIEEVMMRTADILYSLPHLLVVILLMVIMKPGVFTILLALTITGWINMARIVRGQILQIKQNDFVLAAYMLGASRFRILFCHLIPNCIGSIVTTMTLTIPAAIFAEAFLSFLGLGVQAPIASWGMMASDGLPAFRYYPWRLFCPAIFISCSMFAFNLLGDGVRDAFDPRLRT